VHRLEYDEVHDEIVVPQPISQSVLTFRGGAQGDEAPIRVIQGPLTQLMYPEKLTIDRVHNEIFVPTYGGDSILVFPREANGNVAPIRVLKGMAPVSSGRHLVVDPVHNLLFVQGTPATGSDEQPRVFGPQDGEMGRRGILIFDRTAQGNAKPLGFIASEGGHVYVDPPREQVIVVGNAGSGDDQGFYVSVWSIHERGAVSPRRWLLERPQGMPHPMSAMGSWVDPLNKTVLIGHKPFNAVLTYAFPEIFGEKLSTSSGR
jgi:hypothetical protein